MIRIHLKGLKDGVHIKKFTPSFEDLDLPESFSEIAIKAIVEKNGDNLSVNYTGTASAELICDRTLELFTESLAFEQQVYALSDQDDKKENDQVELIRLNKEQNEIDLSASVRDSILLSVPLRKISPGAEEKELPTSFGKVEGEVDPRWKALEKLKSQEQK